MAKWTDYIRAIGTGLGIPGINADFKLEVDDSPVTTVVSDGDGKIVYDANGNPGPLYHTETTGGQTKARSSFALGTVFPAEVPYALMALPDGVMSGIDNTLQAFGDSSGMQVKVKTGLALVKGHVYRGASQQTIAIAANASGNPRIDRVVLRLTRPGQVEEGKFQAKILQGTPAASPTAPVLTQDAATWEISLAQVAVANGAATITSGNVTDERTYLSVVDADDVQTLTNKTLASPTISGTLTATGNANLGDGDGDATIIQGHLKHKSAAPSIAVGAALGTGGSVGAVVTFGSDQAGKVTLTAGTTTLVAGIAATITFATARPDANYAVVLSEANANSANTVFAYVGVTGTTTWQLSFKAAPGSGVIYIFTYAIVEVTN